ncbi:DUF3090 family protein [Nocardioides mangrovicus]|uniref:DUF3090 family protein n=1 Tax=Nocardioides mangrovicus TaxID=2478913 RepID=A0A3L8P2S0_9ACTN|nr:DUF3090 family protein [Nocardioides mangrovicus]RLV48718.1 DUF3090 family protein [Nocardioides mangrovicus]
MPPVVHLYDPPQRFVVGTVGQPGQRTFFVQARDGVRLTSVALEKQQVQILARETDELLDKLIEAGGTAGTIPAITPVDLADSEPLDSPIEEEFRAGTITLSWDADDERVVIEVFAITEMTPEAAADPEAAEVEPEEMLLVRMSPAQARAFCSRAESVVEAGRESCPFCGGPIDPGGHLCPRANGFRRTSA